MQTTISWSDSDSHRADFEGWLMVSTEGGPRIQRRDFEPLFSSDAQAQLYVETQARRGSEFHKAALAFVRALRSHQSPQQLFEQMKASSRYETYGQGATCFVRLVGVDIDYCLSANCRELLYSRACSDPSAAWLSLDHCWKPLTPVETDNISL